MQKFLRLFVMAALLFVPWITRAQNANVSEYDYEVTTANFASIAQTGTVWTAAEQQAGQVDVTMPFNMYLGTSQIASGSTMSVYADGSVAFSALAGARIAPLYYAAGYQAGETSVYYRTTTTMIAVEWRKVVSGSNVYSFQLKLYNDNHVEFCYGPMTINSSLSVLVGLMSSDADIFRCGGTDWSVITRYTSGLTTRTLSTTSHPEYNVTTGQGLVYTFTQPSCVKPSSLTANATAWNAIDLAWTINDAPNRTGFQVKYSDNSDFDPENEGQVKNVSTPSATSTNITGLMGSTTYYFYLRSVCGSGSYSAWSPMASATTPDGCPAPTGAAVSSTGVVSWTASLNNNTYTVKYGVSGFDPATEGTAISGIATTSATVPTAGFPSATTVDVYVNASCSVTGTTTAWVYAGSFVTPCNAIAVNAANPYTESLGNGSIPQCWSDEVLSGSYSWSFSSNGYSTFPYYDGGISRLISPTFSLSTSGAYQVEFYHAECNDGDYHDSLWVYYRTSATGDWVLLDMLCSNTDYSNINLSKAIIILPNPTATYQLAFEGRGHGGYSVYLANVVVRTQPTCPSPSALAVSEVNGNNVTLAWTENGSATNWQIAYYNTDEEVINYVMANANPYTVSNLGLGQWRFYVRSICSVGDTSDWYGYAEQNFGYCVPNVQSTDGSGLTHVSFGESLVVNNTISDGSGYQNFSSMIGDGFRGSALEINLTYSTGSYPYGARVWVDWNQDLDFEDDGELVYTGSSAMSHTFSISIPGSVALGDYRMRIGGSDGSYPSTPCGTFSWSAIQDYTLRVIAAPTCFKPSGLAVSNLQATSATFTWTEAGASTQWELKLGPRGFNPDESGYSVMVNNTPTVTVDYLYMVTNYDAYVRAICNPEGPTAWSNVCEFKTPCENSNNVEIGVAGATNSYLPSNTCYNYSWTEQIYEASEIGGAMVIDNIAFEVTTSVAADRNVTIYLGETANTEFASTTSWIPASSLTQVYTGTMVTTSTGWHKIDFDTPFSYSGNGNLVVAIDDNTGSYKCTAYFRTSSSGGNKALRIYSDGTNYNPNTTTYTGTLLTVRNDIKIERPCDTGSCNAPTTAIALSETEYAATLTFTDVNEEANPTYGIIWGPRGFNPESEGTTVSPITANTYTISNLTQLTDYDVYVYAICSGTPGRKVRYGFTTPFIPNCKTPILNESGYGASNITYNTADITWRQPGDAPLYWVLRYAATDFNPATAAASDYTEMTVTSAAAQLTGLVAGTTYYIYVKSVCAESPLDESPWSASSNANPAYTFTTPTCAVPTGLTATDVTNSTTVLKWNAIGGIQGYVVEYGTADDFTNGTYQTAQTTADSLEITGLDAYTTYYAKVATLCTATDQSVWSSEIAFLTKCPDGGDVEVAGITAGTQYSIPVNTYFNYSYTQQIITAEEMPGATTIQGLSLQYDYSLALDPTKYDVTIYIGTTDKASFASTTDFVDPATLTAVWHGTFNVEQGWNNFMFNTPFEYDGTSNIVVAFDDNVTGYNSSSHKFNTMTTSSPMTLAYYSDSYNPDATSASTLSAFSGSKSTYSYRNVMKLMATCNTEVTCFAPASVSAAITTSNVVTVTWAPRTDLRPIVNNYELKYGLAGFDPETAGILVSDLNDTTQYVINSELAAGVDYDVYVRTVCSETSHSKWTKSAFHTYPNCWVPDSVTITNPTQTSVTIAWRENTPTPATRWQIAYGEEGVDPDNTAKATYVETTNNLNYVLNGLHYMTTYDVYVRAICGENNYSDWSAAAKATTACGILAMEDMPFVENFDGVTGTTSSTIANHVLPNCWDYLNTSTTTATTTTTGYPGYPIAYNSASYSHSGNNHMRFYTYTTDAYGDQYAILPQFGFDVDTLDISLYARESSTTATYVGKILVGVMTDPEDASTFVAVDSIMPTTTTYQYFEAKLSAYEGTGRYVALKAPKPTTGYNIAYVDDLTVKVREQLIPVTASQTVEACNAFVMADTTALHGTYANNLNATYVVKPADAGKVAHITGEYDLENGYDFISIYRGTATAANLLGTYTGAGSIDFVTSSHNWVDSGFFTIVVTSDADNALNYTGFKFLVSCECPAVDTNIIVDQVEANGEYTWTAGNGLTYANHSTNAVAVDVTAEVDYTLLNVAQCDSANRHLSLVLHPDYTINYGTVEICQGENYEFYDTVLATTGNYTVTMQNTTGADSTGIITLQVNPLPTVTIKYNNEEVTSIDNFCDNFDMELVASSNLANATYLWEDSSTVANRIVNPHESSIYTVVATNPNTGCVSTAATLTVNTTPVPELTINGDSAICAGQSTTLTLSDANNIAATYRWTLDNVNVGTETSLTVNPTETATYVATVTPTGATECAVSAEFTVTVNALPVVTLANSVNEFCLGDSLTVSATEVEGYTYSWNTGDETAAMTTVPAAAGNYTATLTVTETATGCVNEFTSEAVAVYPSYELNDNQSACVGMLPYTWGEMSLTDAGSYEQTFTIAHGCDSLVHLAFEIEDTAVNTTSRELCLGTEFTFGTGIYEQAYTATETGVITYVDTTSDVCAARYNLNLTVNMPATTTDEATACDTYTWNGNEYTVSGEYTDTLATSKGCDSVVTMNLTVNYSNTGVDEQIACDSYEWINGVTYTESINTPTYTLTNAGGCDSVVTLNLTVNTKTYGVDEIVYCDGFTYEWINGRSYTTNTTGVNFTLPTPNAAGCDSIVTLDLTMNPVYDTLAWRNDTALDEYAINTVSCEGEITTTYLHESGDYELRTRNTTTGADRIERIHLVINHSSYHTVFDTACAQYTWFVETYEVGTYTQSGTYSYDRGNGNIEVLMLTINQPVYDTTDTVAICKNGVWTDGNGQDFAGADYETGVYQWNTITSTDPTKCETRQMVDLTVNEVYNIDNDVVMLCASAFTYVDSLDEYQYTYAVNDTTNDMIAVADFAAAQNIDRSFAYTAATGCDSVVNFHFTVNPMVETIQSVAACYKYTWDLNGNEYTESGFDTMVVADQYGCDSTVILDLTINSTVEGNIDTTVCMTFTWNEVTYTESQRFLLEDGLTAKNGCDSVTYLNFIVKNHQLNNQIVVANVPYTWINGQTYTESVSNIFYDVTPDGECDSVLMLTLTMLNDTLTLCESALPYETDFGYTVAAGTTTGLDNAIDEQGSGYYIYNKINATGNTAYTEHGCNSFTWTVNGEEYTEDGDYIYTYAADANGCQRVDTLHLTISAYNEVAVADTACGTYTWSLNGETYTVSGSYNDTIAAITGCDTIVTLNLVIPAGQKYEVTECYEYTWMHADSTTQVFTTSDSVGYSYVEPVSGCTVEDTLVLTINTYSTDSNTVIKNMASYTFNNVLYTAPTDTVIFDTVANPTGCDSVHITRLIVSDGVVVDVDTLYCGNFLWEDGNVYGWISGQEALQNGTIFRYKNLTTGEYVYQNPEYYVFDANGALDTTFVLWLTLAEASVDSIDYGTVLASQVSVTPVTIGDSSFYFADELAAKHDTTVVKEVRYGSAYYCDSVEYYTFHLVYNYTVEDTVILCGAETEYTWREQNWPLDGAGLTTTLTDIADAGTADEWVYSINVTQRAAVVVTDTTATACDSFTWNDSTYTASTTTAQYTYTDQNGCDSTVTLNLTVYQNTNGIGNVTTSECYEYTWSRTNSTDSTYAIAGTYTHEYLTSDGCPSVDTLVLTLTGFDTTYTVTVCDTYTWEVDGNTYTVSGKYPADFYNGCPVKDTLVLTVNYSTVGNDIDTVYGSYALVDDVMYEGRSDKDTTHNIVRHLTNAAGCDSTVNLTLVIRSFRDSVINEIACGTYTWDRGEQHTYQWISAAERAANNDALYLDVTTNEYVYTYPSDTVDNTIYRLNLALNEAMIIDTTINFPLSQQMMTFGTENYNFAAENAAVTAASNTVAPGAFYGNPVIKTVSMGSSSHYCDSIYKLTINLVNNYYTADTAICYTTDFEWNGKHHTVSTGLWPVRDTFFVGTPDERVVTMNVDVAGYLHADTNATACDSFTWGNVEFTASGNYDSTYISPNGCDSVVTLHLTINTNNGYWDGADGDVVRCDFYDFQGNLLTESCDTTITWADDNGCEATDHFTLTIVSATPSVTDTNVCDNFHWVINNSDDNPACDETFNTSTVFGTKHYENILGQQCWATDSLFLTVRHSSSYDSVLYISDGSYRYGDTMLMATTSFDTFEVYTNAEQCDSTLNLTFNVGTAYFLTENIISCDTFVWEGRTGDTYAWIDNDESAANGNALYKNQTTGEYVMHNPVFVKENEGDYDSIIMLRLTLTQIYTGVDDTNFNISNEILTYGDSVFDFSAMATAAENFHDTTVMREVHFGSGYYCDSVINLYINLTNNFVEVADTDICATATEVAWRGQTLSTANTEYDVAHTYHIYDTLASGIVEYMTINQHQIAYITERRTACDSYTWEETGDVFTESTTISLGGGIDNYGCPAIVNLILTVNHNSSKVTDTTVCESFVWTANNAAQTVLGTFTNDTTVTYNYTSDEGCPSTDELILVVNHNTNTVVRDTVCDSYDWTVANGEDAGTYTTSGAYWYDYTTAEGCASTDSLYLVVKYSSPATTIDTAACERLVWNDVEYISSSHYTQHLVNAAGCDSVVTINLTIGHPSVTVIDSTVCDSLVWNTVAYTVSGSYTDTLPAIGGCDSIVTINLTVNNADSRATEVVACRNYTWDLNGITYTTSGDYVVNGTNEFGCESNDTLHLTIGNNRTYSYENVTNCGPYTWIVDGEEVGTFESDIETSATVVNPNNGCDSIIFLTLTIKEAPVVDSAYTVCESAMPFTWRDTTLTEAGTVSVTFPLVNGCDSTINMTLTVTPTINTVLNENVCLGLGYNNNNFNIAATELPTAGTYTFVDSLVSTATGCDSIVTLNITVGDLLTTVTEQSACETFAWTAGNNTVYNYTVSGTYFTEPYINEQGCTSVDTLVLTINMPVATTDDVTACDSYNWNGVDYTTSGTYVDTLATVNGCDSIVTMTLTINNSVNTNDSAIACNSYLWNNVLYTVSGVYTDTLPAANGCDSIVTMNLTINMPVANAISETACGVYVWNDSVYDQSGTYEQTLVAENGCDSVVTLTLTVNSASTSEETLTVCDSYTWNDSVYTESGVYTYTANNASGCDSVATLNLTVNVSTTSEDTVSACNYYEWNGTAYTTSGTYTFSATNAAGCDSTATLVLTINAPVATAISETACESFTWNNATYSTTGDYTQTFTAANGCDSVVTLSLTINNAVNASETAEACNSYTWNGTEYTTSGNYTYTTTAANGCDSIVTLTLTINEPATETVNATACGSYAWNGQTYTASGIYTYNTTAANGCDSVVTLALTVNQPVYTTINQTACDSYTWNGATYTTSGEYTYTGTAANGCDSVVTLALTINNAVATAETAEACDSYTWNGETYTTSGTYTWTGTTTNGCDSVVTLTLTVNSAATSTETAEACDSYVWNGIAYAASGTYTYTTTAANGCDSVVTLNLTINQSVAVTVTETAETNLVWNGVTYYESGTYTWTGTAANGCDSTVTLVLTINNSIFDTNYYTVAAEILNPGMGEVTGTGVYADGSVVTLTATPNDGFSFVAWMMGNDTVTTTLQHTFTVVSDTTFTAVFVALPVYYTVSGVANDPTMGYVEQNPTLYEAGATAHLTAQANDGYHFVRWSNGETTPDIYFTVTCDITLTAYFEADEPVTGVDETNMNDVTIYSSDTRIFVRGAEGYDVYVYDVNGRVMNSQLSAGEMVEFRMPATGVYLVKVGNAPAKRVLVVR